MRFIFSTSSRLAVVTLMIAIGCGGAPGEMLTIPDSPDGTVRVVMQGLSQHRPVVLWRAMPPSYQQDVLALSAGFADNIDPGIFDRAVAVARKGAVVLQSKKELILSTETMKGADIDEETLDALWEGYVHFLDAILASELSSLDGFRELDVDGFLSTTGVTLMDQATAASPVEAEAGSLKDRLAALEETDVELVRQDGDTATIRVNPPDADPADVEMIRIEGMWVPVDFVEQWSGFVEQTNAKIEYLGSEDAASAKVQLLFAIGVAEGFIDQIDQMESPEELDDLIGGLLGNIMPRQSGQMVTEG